MPGLYWELTESTYSLTATSAAISLSSADSSVGSRSLATRLQSMKASNVRAAWCRVVDAIRAFPFEALKTILLISQQGADNCKARIVKAGGIGCIMSAIKHHESESAVYTAVWKVLDTLCYDDEGHFVSAGGIDCILWAMKEHRTAASVQINACKVLNKRRYSFTGMDRINTVDVVDCTVSA